MLWEKYDSSTSYFCMIISNTAEIHIDAQYAPCSIHLKVRSFCLCTVVHCVNSCICRKQSFAYSREDLCNLSNVILLQHLHLVMASIPRYIVLNCCLKNLISFLGWSFRKAIKNVCSFSLTPPQHHHHRWNVLSDVHRSVHKTNLNSWWI